MAQIDDLKTYLGISGSSEDTPLTLLLAAANGFVNKYIGRIIAQTTNIEFYNGAAEKELLLKNYPVTTLTSFEYNTGTLDTPVWTPFTVGTYRLHGTPGKIFCTFNLPRGFQNIKVVYVAWFSSLPADLNMAILRIAAAYYNKRNADGIKSETVNGDSITFADNDNVIPDDILTTLSLYRSINV